MAKLLHLKIQRRGGIYAMRIIVFLIAMLSVTCSDKNKTDNRTNTIDIASAIDAKKYEILNLSDYATSIEYIPLETNENCYIKRIGDICFESNNIYINDDLYYQCSKFSRDGKFQKFIGNKGQGPGEYPGNIRGIDIVPEANRVFLTTFSYIYEYQMDGSFVKRINIPNIDIHDIDIHFVDKAIYINPELFLCDLISTRQTEYNFALYDTASVVRYLDNDLQPIRKEQYSFGSSDRALITRTGNNFHYLKCMKDTIYTVKIEPEINLIPAYVLNYGKYNMFESRRDIHQWDNLVTILNMVEYGSSIFLCFDFSKWAPEPFEEEFTNPRDGRAMSFLNKIVCGIYNKETHILHLLKHPIPKSIGLKNDIDGGLTFWPAYISTSGEMIMYYTAEKVLEAYKNLENPPEKLTKLVEHLLEDDNPVAIIAKLK